MVSNATREPIRKDISVVKENLSIVSKDTAEILTYTAPTRQRMVPRCITDETIEGIDKSFDSVVLLIDLGLEYTTTQNHGATAYHMRLVNFS